MEKSQKFFLQRFSLITFFLFSALFLLRLKGSSEEVTVRALCYGPGLYGQKTASGQILNTATTGVAHRNIRLGSNIKLKYQGKELETKVIDRGPFTRGVELDLTEGLVKSWGFQNCRHFGVRKVVIVKE
ncbi:MAG: septal ring lytic transglycosylase RlpA family protein [Candidatus Caenarcaniphilales bacterium]|nr:septal ring lytic transglycosylase RlpA family protein [Candidatus Caenarcaniphilales bacterium]